jgi:NitT/TauT family transport system substrate-binding protein
MPARFGRAKGVAVDLRGRLSPRVSRRTALAATGCALLAPHVALGQATTTITSAGLPEDSATPVLYAIASGLFRRYGLDVRLQPQRSGPAVASGVAGGAYQIGKASINPLVIAHAHGVPFVLVAPGGLSTATNPIAGLMVKADSPVQTAADLNGKTIAVGALNDIFTLALKTWMDKNGGDSSSVKLVEITISAIAEAIETGRVVAGSANEPILGAALASGKVRVLAHTFDAIAPRFMFTAWFTTQAYAREHPQVVDGFARAVREAAAYVNAHHDETVDLIARFTSIDPAVVRRMTRTEDGTTLDPRLVQPVIDAAARYKDIPVAFDAREIIA